MKLLNDYLLPNERTALIEALRRDTENERLKALQYPQWRDYHLQNVRLNVRILEAFGYRHETVGLPEPDLYRRSSISSSS
ncbi:hypothetical protein B0920_12240 [Massilia sp. KIM]|uniref:hypothetical protein n=1 Tax=Massilia sp. KIM TaxID=1955422 RepID=UPI00098EFEA8|nr:hypothetical protein [Massilia sp. KIM]OON64062.1 hypothetical protein B0920_12240 [Massilia sp. KIM]